MQQRVGIAIAMCMTRRCCWPMSRQRPGCLRAKTGGGGAALHLRRLFGTAVILVTHDVGVVSAMADTILVLKEGNVMEYGPARQILQEPQNSYTRALLTAVPRLRRA